MAPFFGAGGPVHFACSASAHRDCIGPPACKKRRPSGWHRGGLLQPL